MVPVVNNTALYTEKFVKKESEVNCSYPKKR